MSPGDPTRPGLDRQGPGIFQLCLLATLLGGLGIGLATWAGECLRSPGAQTHEP